ncbi:gamma carbonic anhydrase family protein [Sedimenticola sp.]|uniref:gamma carbonic anhydrase family protein n=1 Tax=Sedimenticola sp. TaxID=1940285 RepID=UPI003D0F5609
MLIQHNGKMPTIDATAYVAPNAVVCGDVTVGPGCRILFGAQVIAESGAISIGQECIIMENAVLRSSARHPLNIGNNCLVGPNAHVVGCTLEDQVFIATGSAIFHAAYIGRGSEVRINGVVHLKTHLAEETTVPIGWVAVGNPAQVLPPDAHEQIWEIQRPLNFPLTVYGFERDEVDMVKITRRLSESLAAHVSDQITDTALPVVSGSENG